MTNRKNEFLTKLAALMHEYNVNLSVEDRGRAYLSDYHLAIQFNEPYEDVNLGYYADNETILGEVKN